MLTLTPAQTLMLWHDAHLMLVRGGEPDLSARQMTILLTVYLEAPPHTVRGLAQKLHVAKPVVTRALDALSRLKLLTRRRDPADGRNVLVQRSVEGALFLERLSSGIVNLAKSL